MREITVGWESGDIVAEGFTGTGIGVINSVAANQHQDRAGAGGTYCLSTGGGSINGARNRYQQTQFLRNLVECWDRDMIRLNTQGGSAGRQWVHAFYSGADEVASVCIDSNTRAVSLYLGTATNVANSANNVIPLGAYCILDMRFRMLDAGGLFEAYIDGVLVVSFAGDTRTTTATTFNTLGIASSWNGLFVDEVGRNSLTLLYTGGVGVFLAGDTITGGTSGATAVVTSVETSAGRLVLRTWSGTAFQAGETITGSGSGATGLVSAPTAAYLNGFEPNSGRLGNGFIVARVPNGVGTTTQLASSSGNPNWQNVDERPPNSTDDNTSGTADQYDTYLASALPASATGIVVVAGYVYAHRDGTQISNFRPVVRTNGADYFSSSNGRLATSYAAELWNWNVNPATGTTWTTSEAGSAEPGFQVRT